MLRNKDWGGGNLGGVNVGSPTFLGLDVDPLAQPRRYALLCLVLFLILALAVMNLRRGSTGRRMLAIRSNERAAAALGRNVAATKLYAFGLSGAIAAVAGTLIAFRSPFANFDSGWDVLSSVSVLIYAVVGGVGVCRRDARGGYPRPRRHPGAQSWNSCRPTGCGSSRPVDRPSDNRRVAGLAHAECSRPKGTCPRDQIDQAKCGDPPSSTPRCAAVDQCTDHPRGAVG